jgi:hypothetical protein
VSWLLTLFAHELPLQQVLPLWDFFLAQAPTILVTLAASIIILRVDTVKGCLRDQLSLLSAPPAIDLLRCKVGNIFTGHTFSFLLTVLEGPRSQLGR